MVEFLLGVPARLNAIATALAAGIASLTSAIGTRAPAGTAVSNAVLTDARIGMMDNLANIANAPARIKSIQRGTINIPGGSTFATVTLGTTVDPNKCDVSNLGAVSIGNTISNFNVGGRVQLVDGSSVRGWSGGGTNAIDIGYQIVEFW